MTNLTRVSSAQSATILPTSDDSKIQGQRRLEVFADSSFEKVKDTSAEFNTGLLTDTQRAQVASSFNALPADDQLKVSGDVASFNKQFASLTAGTGSTAEATAALNAVIVSYATASSGALRSTSAAQKNAASDDQSTVSDIMAFGMSTVEGNTQGIANQVKAALEVKKDIRETATELNDMVANWPEDGSKQSFTYNEYDSETGTVTNKTVELSKEEATALAKDMEDQVQTWNGITDTLQFDLQNAYQAQQQMMSVLSEIMKSMHDTMKNTLGNVR